MGFQTEVMDIIKKRTNIKYHEVNIYRLLHKCGFALNVPMKIFVRGESKEDKKKFKKGFKNSDRS
jgi:transposase